MEQVSVDNGVLCRILSPRPLHLRRVILLSTLLTLICCFEVSARPHAQTVSFSGKDVPLQTVLASFEKQTGLSFFFNYALLKDAKPVTLQVRNVAIERALKEALKDENLDFYQQGKTIFIVKKQSMVSSDSPVPGAKLTDVTGRVFNQQGEPLVGATVAVKNGRRATITNEKGSFELRGVPVGATLEVTHMGYQRREVEIGGGQLIQVEMLVANNKLDEVQVIAYGNTSERLGTGNITTVKSAEIDRQPVNNPLLALEGRVPGLFIAQTNGLPGGGVTVRVQGQNSIGRGNDPLYVIDGVPYVSQLLPTSLGAANSPLGVSGTGFGANYGNPMSYINPADIESITVLKDADATAIYGSRAANGAILITTKKGRIGHTRGDVNLQNGWGWVGHEQKQLNTKQYLQMRHEAESNDGLTIKKTDYDINGTWDTTRYTDWQRVLIGSKAQYSNIVGAVSGGSDNTQYLVGATYHRETTVFPGKFADQKGAVHFNLSSSSADQKFRLQLSGNYVIDNNKLPQLDLTNEALYLAPDAPPLRNSDGSINWMPTTSGTSSFYPQPIANLYNTYQNKTTNLVSNAVLSYHFFPGLELRSSFGYTNLQSNEYAAYPFVAIRPESQVNSVRAAYFTNNNINSWIVEPQANYKRAIGKGRLELLVGATIQQNNNNGQQIYGYGYNSDAVLHDILSAPNIGVASTTNAVYKYNAFFSRVTYNWKEEFIVDLTGRRDGSSRFGSQSQFHNFGAIGGAWVFTQENFVKKRLSALSYGKIRGSYGTTGNDQIGDYAFLNLYTPISTTAPYQGAGALGPSGLPNPYLRWEETKKLQIGIDLGLLKDRILLNANYVRNQSSNQLLPYALPSFVGFGNIVENFPATVQNTAWEFALNIIWIKSKSFTWNTVGNLTVPNNKLVSFPNLATSTYARTLIVGQPISIIKVFHFLGVDPTTGKYGFSDSHGNATSTPSSLTDKIKLANTLPRVYGGVENSFTYKGVQVDIMMQFVEEKAMNNFFGTYIPGAYNINQPISVLKRWQSPGDITNIQRFSSNSSLATQYYAATSSDKAYSDASYIRVKNISISYEFPEKWQRKIHLQNSRIYVQGQNLFTITKYKGLDPENLSPTALPPLRVLTLGVQIGL